MTKTDLRAKFEEWCVSVCGPSSTKVWLNGDYDNVRVQDMWEGYQACFIMMNGEPLEDNESVCCPKCDFTFRRGDA